MSEASTCRHALWPLPFTSDRVNFISYTHTEDSSIQMSNIPENLRYSRDHEWVEVADDVATIGITDYAQHSLGDVVYIDMPRVGDKLGPHEAFGSVESVKAVSEIFTPVSGEVVEVNDGLNDAPEAVNNE